LVNTDVKCTTKWLFFSH